MQSLRGPGCRGRGSDGRGPTQRGAWRRPAGRCTATTCRLPLHQRHAGTQMWQQRVFLDTEDGRQYRTDSARSAEGNCPPPFDTIPIKKAANFWRNKERYRRAKKGAGV